MLLAMVISSTNVENNYNLQISEIKNMPSSELKCVLLKARNISLHQGRVPDMSFTTFKIRNTLIS